MTARTRKNAPPDAVAGQPEAVAAGVADTPGPVATAFPVVGVGASAGGLAAFSALFDALPAAAGRRMALVLVQHLAPDHDSLLAELIGRHTSMDVAEAVDGTAVRPGHVYIIPPGRDLVIEERVLRLVEPTASRGHRLPVDGFLRSLAADVGPAAVAIVLSGSGRDGADGVRAIKQAGGMVLAQDARSAEYDEMPAAAIAAGAVDEILAPDAIARALARHVGEPAEADDEQPRGRAEIEPPIADEEAAAIARIAGVLHARTGHDVSGYRQATVGRRIHRRMAARRVETLDAYLDLLEREEAEVQALFDDLFIGVTSFFRDPAAFDALAEQVIPRMFAGKSAGATIRAWVVGCSTGEEAYSIALLLHEHLESTGQRMGVVVFATDIDGRAVATARRGRYPGSALAGVSPERLARFFVPEADGDGYRVHKSVRDSVVFSEQDVIRDPPFSRLDLVSCRNLLIYLDDDVQRRLIPLFHYALDPGGHLFLGGSETVGGQRELFSVVDRRARLYAARETTTRSWGASIPTPGSRGRGGPAARTAATRAATPGPSSLRLLTEQGMLDHGDAVGILVEADGDVLYLHGRIGRYLEPAPGDAARSNVLRMARDGLRGELALGLHEAAARGVVVRRVGVPVHINGDVARVDVTIRPVQPDPSRTPAARRYLVVVEEAPARPSDPVEIAAAMGPPDPEVDASDATPGPDAEGAAALRHELHAKQEILETALRELAMANEELLSANEELQSVNEELQSSNEELETSKEELQSTNEELATVNAELEARVHDLSRANDDLANLVSGTGIATIFVDRQLCVMRFTPTAPAITNLIPGDIGRPISQIASNLVGYEGLAHDAAAVLASLTPRALDVQATDGRWYTVRFQAYRTMDDVIAGVVITFVEVTEKKRAETVLQASEQRFHATVDALLDPLVVLEPRRDPDGSVVDFAYQYANRAACDFHGLTLAQMVGQGLLERLPDGGLSGLLEPFVEVMETGVPFARDGVIHRERGSGGWQERITDTRANRLDEVLVVTWRDVTVLKDAEARIRAFNEDLGRRVSERTEALERANHELETFTYSISHDLSTPLRAINGFTTLFERHVGDSLDERGRHYLSVVKSSGARMGALIESLLDFARLSRHVVRAIPLDWDALVTAMRTEVSEHAAGGRVGFEVVEPLAKVAGDQHLVGRILAEVVRNALTYHAPGATPHIVLRTVPDPGGVRIEISDAGIGIPAEYLDRVFEPFVRLHREEEYPGIGIGLAIARRSARLMGTDLTVTSEPGAGSTFALRLSTVGSPARS